MKKMILSCVLIAVVNLAFSQVVATVNLTGNLKIKPGSANEVTVSVKNTQKVAIVKYQSDYMVTLVYRGSTSEGQSINAQVNLGDPLGPGDTRNIKVRFTGPKLPGEYDVDVFLKWGSKTVSNVDKVSFVVAADYEVHLTAKFLSIDVKGGAVRDVDLRFNVKNIGLTSWPEGRYSLDFEVVSTPGGASKVDKEAFSIDPKTIERWDFEPGESDEYVYQDFRPPLTDGSYVVKVTLLFEGKPFDAGGNPQNLTFKISGRN
jgi:hypothetical protein